jgi:ribosome maturation factor RimP
MFVVSREEKIESWIEEILAETDCFIVSSKLGTDANFKFFIDSDTGFSLDKSTKINRALRNQIDESGLFPEGNYSLEISSPGISEPLKMPRQYKKNIGRLLEIKTTEEEVIEGRLKEITENEIILEVKGKNSRGLPSDKLPKKMKNIDINNISKATVQVEFK